MTRPSGWLFNHCQCLKSVHGAICGKVASYFLVTKFYSTLYHLTNSNPFIIFWIWKMRQKEYSYNNKLLTYILFIAGSFFSFSKQPFLFRFSNESIIILFKSKTQRNLQQVSVLGCNQLLSIFAPKLSS